MLSITTLLVVVLVPAGVLAVQGSQKSRSTATKQKMSGPYCGVYCLYAATKLVDKNIDFVRLLKPEYIGSYKGSSLGELKKAAEDNGMYAVPVEKLSSRELRHSSYPIILHVKSTPDKKEYDHFELFLGTEDGKARLFDPPEEPIRLLPFHELAPRWDGTGLIVSAAPIDTTAVFAPTRKKFVFCAAVAILSVLIVHWTLRMWPIVPIGISRRQWFVLSLAQCVGLCGLACLGGLVYHFAEDEGFLAHANANASIVQAHQGNFIPQVSAKKAGELLNTDTVFIDARLVRDFEAGHLEGAINIPVNFTDEQRQKALSDVAKDSRIVVYCQSTNCKFAERIAIKLMADGFSNIFIFKKGWREWVEQKL